MSMCNVIGVLGDHEEQMWRTLPLRSASPSASMRG